MLDLDKQGINSIRYKRAIEKADSEFRKMKFSYIDNNCMDYVACVLNNMKYDGKTNHKKYSVAWKITRYGYYN